MMGLYKFHSFFNVLFGYRFEMVPIANKMPRYSIMMDPEVYVCRIIHYAWQIMATVFNVKVCIPMEVEELEVKLFRSVRWKSMRWSLKHLSAFSRAFPLLLGSLDSLG